MPPLPVPDGTDVLDIEEVYVLQWFARNGRTYVGFYLDLDKFTAAVDRAKAKGTPYQAFAAGLGWKALP